MSFRRQGKSHFLKTAAVCVACAIGLVLLSGGNRSQSIGQTTEYESTSGERLQPVWVRGRELFLAQCAACHGDSGDGDGKFAYLMNPRPRNFQTDEFKLATTENQIPTDEDLLRTISRGMPGSAMPPWGHLPQSDLVALVKYVRKIKIDATRAQLDQYVIAGEYEQEELEEELSLRTEPGTPLRIPPEPPFDSLRWFQGRRVYLDACAACHGVDGYPMPEAVKMDDEDYPVPPRSFVNGIFKGGSEGHQLYARIVKGLKGTPMPAFEDLYKPDEIWDLIHYVQSLARKGAQDRAQLKQGTFAAPRVSGGALPDNPLDDAWNQARPLYVALTPLWWTEDRVQGLVAHALHDGKKLAIRLSWIDPTVDDRAVRHEEFRDAVALQFSLTSDPPFYMGSRDKNGGVNIWFWKADRQKDIASGHQDVDAAFVDRVADMYPEQLYATSDAIGVQWPFEPVTKHDQSFITAWGAGNLVANPKMKTPVEFLVARGPGTLSAKPAHVQLVQGQAIHQNGVWYVQMQRSMDLSHEHGPEDERCLGMNRLFKAGDYVPVSFAIWNGSAGDRNGKKNISIWQKLVIE